MVCYPSLINEAVHASFPDTSLHADKCGALAVTVAFLNTFLYDINLADLYRIFKCFFYYIDRNIHL
jgi:hypothetical protein